MAREQPTLHLVSGLPCSGKSTYARRLESDGVYRVSVDELMITVHGRLGVDYRASTHVERLGPVIDDARDRVRALLASGSDVVLDHGLGLRDERDAWKLVAQQNGAAWSLVRFDADLATLRARCALRSLDPDSVPISDDLLRRLAASWEPPADEGEQLADSTSEWVKEFYDITDRWWGVAESAGGAVDLERAAWLVSLVDVPAETTVLELGCGSGATAVATAGRGFDVTGIDFSDRIERAPAELATFIRADFSIYMFDEQFDIVTYWDGFGVGHDHDQLALLNRIADHLVKRDGLVIVEVFDPTGWEHDDGLLEHLAARPEQDYPYALDHARTYDATTGRAVDAWREPGNYQIWSQSLRCYSPADFRELVSASRLEFVDVLSEGRSAWSYIAVLRPGAHHG